MLKLKELKDSSGFEGLLHTYNYGKSEITVFGYRNRVLDDVLVKEYLVSLGHKKYKYVEGSRKDDRGLDYVSLTYLIISKKRMRSMQLV